jgi:hypothetical protein
VLAILREYSEKCTNIASELLSPERIEVFWRKPVFSRKEHAMSYSPFFQVLHDERQTVGNFGRGTHYSVLRAPIWRDEHLKPLQEGELLDFAIIWDEDHDDRVIEVIEEMYFGGLLAPVRFIGERKGTPSVLIDNFTRDCWAERTLRDYCAAVSRISASLDDPWPADVDVVFGRASSIVHGSPDDAETYLKNIELLWQLGRRPGAPYIFGMENASGSVWRLHPYSRIESRSRQMVTRYPFEWAAMNNQFITDDLVGYIQAGMPGYIGVDGKQLPEGSNTPDISIGKCSAL